VEVWHRAELPGEQAGSRQGLGCSANTVIAACSYAGPAANVVAYDYDGARLWDSGAALDATAFASAPLVLADGSVIAADRHVLVRFTPLGATAWQTPLPHGGIPISPVTTQDGSVVVLATQGGPVYAFDVATGAAAGVLFIRRTDADPGFFETANTPAVRGNRVYVVAHHQIGGVRDAGGLSWLVAVDVGGADLPPESRLTVAWHHEFGGPSGASPLAIGPDIFFDGDRAAPGGAIAPRTIAVRDTGAAPQLLWQQPSGGLVRASFARDPRPGATFWMYLVGRPWLLRRAAQTGALVQAFDLDALIGETGRHVPLSALTIAGPGSRPVMLLGATAFGAGATFAAAVDLETGGLLWKVPVPGIGGWYTAGQFPILLRDGQPRAVFTTYNSGARAIGAR
jgi:outer membrane protein assembly factor BamB